MGSKRRLRRPLARRAVPVRPGPDDRSQPSEDKDHDQERKREPQPETERGTFRERRHGPPRKRLTIAAGQVQRSSLFPVSAMRVCLRSPPYKCPSPRNRHAVG